MILSFRDQATEDFYHNRPMHPAARVPANIRSTALRKLDILNAAHRLTDL
jgi:plasmid maintenance system killer protein